MWTSICMATYLCNVRQRPSRRERLILITAARGRHSNVMLFADLINVYACDNRDNYNKNVCSNWLKFGHWLTMCTLNIHLLTYFTCLCNICQYIFMFCIFTSCIFMSSNFMFCYFVPLFRVLQFHVSILTPPPLWNVTVNSTAVEELFLTVALRHE